MQSDTAHFWLVIEQNGRHTDQVTLAHLKYASHNMLTFFLRRNVLNPIVHF